MLRIRKDDKVMVIAGKDKGKVGKVIRVMPSIYRAIVENINVVKKARRRTKQDQQGGLIEIEASIHVSNLLLVDKKTNNPTRFGVRRLKDGSKERISKETGEVI